FIYKVWTTWEAYKTNLQLQKQSREWSWESYVCPGAASSYLMDITFGGYTIISLALFIGHLAGDPKTKGEAIMLVVGCLLMFSIGAMLATWVDDVPHKLVDNTIVLIVLSLITGILLLVDAGTGKRMKKGEAIDRNRKLILEKKMEEAKLQAEQAKPVDKSVVEVKEEKKGTENQETQTFGDPAAEGKTDSGISSVQIRIKEPRRSWTEYKRSQALADLDVLSPAERADDMLHTPSSDGDKDRSVSYVMRERFESRHLPSLKASPIRHTTAHYIHGVPTPFTWTRLKENN
ncbi:hypothetical protein AAG570_001337, partial [Ranatra chinensis]